MEANDTVIKCDTNLTCCLDCHETQAEISFKAGIAKGYSAGMIEGQYTNHKKHGKKMIKARQGGRMEVVDFANHFAGIKHNPEWKAKLKEWGIK